MALLAFDPSLYTSDWSHPTAPTTLLTGMSVYAALYRDLVHGFVLDECDASLADEIARNDPRRRQFGGCNIAHAGW